MKHPPFSHQDRAAEAFAYAGRLQADLASLTGMLDPYRSPAARLDELRETASRCCRQLEAITGRLHALSRGSDPGKYTLSDQEHAALDDARDLRTRMMHTLADLQQSERTTYGRKT